MSKIILVGEPMALFMADSEGELSGVRGYNVGVAGAEFNVAVAMERLGHNASYLTKLGNDPFGKLLITLMNESGVDTSFTTHTSKFSTGMMLKSLVKKEDPEIYYYRARSAASTLCDEDIENVDFSGYSNLHMTGILPALSESTRQVAGNVIKRAREKGLVTSFDPNIRKQLWPNEDMMCLYLNHLGSMCDIFLPGLKEGRILTGKDTPEEIAEYYLKGECKVVCIKLGEEGCFVATEEESFYVEGFKVDKIVDTVGAGDGFAAGFVSALMEGLSLREAARRGNAIGAIQLGFRGDNSGLPNREELDTFMNR